MNAHAALVVALAAALGIEAAAQTRTSGSAKTPAKAPAAPAATVEPAVITCPSPLGTGVNTKREFCDVPIGRSPADGIAVKLPPHKGTAALRFDLHNRQTYSEEQVRARRAYALTTATIGVLTMDNTLITRAVVQNEFRSAADLFDRIGGGAGPGGLKAVAPTGAESIRVEIPENVTEVVILGEKLQVSRFEGAETFVAPGRPVALISAVQVEYQPVPLKKAPAKAPARKTPAKKPAKK